MFKRLTILMLSALALTACGDSTAPAERVDGTYQLVAFNGQPLPATFFQNIAGRVQYTGGNIVLRSDLSYTENLNVLRTLFNTPGTPDRSNLVENGTYTVTGNSIILSIAGGRSYTGSVGDGVLRYVFNDDSYEFRR